MFVRVVGTKDCYVADTDAAGIDTDTLFDNSVRPPIIVVVAEKKTDEILKLGMLVLSQVALLDLAVNVIGVGMVAGPEVLVDGEQSRSGRHGHPLQ